MSCTKGEESVVDAAEVVSSCVTDIGGGISGAEDGSCSAATMEAATVNGISVSGGPPPAPRMPPPATECIGEDFNLFF